VEFDPFGGFQLKVFLAMVTPTPERQKDIDFLLILENAKITNVDKVLLD